MSDQDPWARPVDPTVHVVGRHRSEPAPAAPPYAAAHHAAHHPVHDTTSRPGWVVPVVVVVGATCLLLVLGIVSAIAIPLFLSQRDTAEAAADAERSKAHAASSVVDGEGYRYRMPLHWTDVTEQARAQPNGTMTDTAFAWSPADGGAPSSIVVESVEAPGTSLDDVASRWRDNLASTLPGGVEVARGAVTTIDGERAVTMTAQDVPAAIEDMDMVSFVTARDDRYFSVTFTFPAAGEDDGQLLVERTVPTWEWD